MGTLTRDNVASIIDKIAPDYGIDPELYKTIVYNGENFGNKTITDATNPKSGASGPAQVMAANFRPGENPADPETNIRAGARVLADAKKLYPDSPPAQAAYYNSGKPGGDAVAAGKQPPAVETQQYLKRLGMDPITSENATSARVTARTSPYDGDITTRLNDVLNAITGATEDIAVQRGTMNKSAGAASEATLGVGKAGAAATQTQAQIDNAQATQKNALLNAFSANALDPNSDMIDAIARVQDARKVKNMLSPQLQQMAGTTFLENPMQWVQNYLAAPKVLAAWHAADMQEKTNNNFIVNTSAELEAAQRVNPAMVTTLVEKKAVEEGNVKILQSAAQAADILRTNAAANAQLDMNGIAVSREALTATTQAANAQAIKLSLGLSDKANPEDDLVKVNKIRASAFAQPFTPGEWKGLKPEEKQLYINAIGDMGSYGNDAGKALKLLSVIGGRSDQTALTALRDVRTDPAYEAIKRNASMDPSFKKLSAEDQNVEVLSQLSRKQTEEAFNPQSVNSEFDPHNPYRLKLENTLLVPELANNPITALVKQLSDKRPLGAGHVTDKELRDQVLAQATLVGPSGVPALAQQLNQFYMLGIAKQLERTGALRLGYKVPSGYGVADWNNVAMFDSDPDPGKNYRNVGMQMGSVTEIEHALTSFLAQRARKNSSIFETYRQASVDNNFNP